MSLLQLKLLGGMTVLNQDGQRIDLRGRKAVGLLAFLSMQADQTFTRAYLANLFWPDSKHHQARHSLRQALADLRKHIDGLEHNLNPQASRIGLTTDVVNVDALQFVNSAQHADVISMRHASTLYQGDFLDGLDIKASDFEKWRDAQRRRLRQRMVHVLEELANHALLDGNPAQTTALLQRVLQVAPCHEPAHYHLMELYARQGQLPAAMKQYQTLSAILSTELHNSPSAKTESLYQRIIQQRAPLELVPNNIPTIRADSAQTVEITTTHQLTNTSPPTLPLIGRDTEFQQIQRALTALYHQPSGQCFILRGDEGIGKTRLACECAQLARQQAISTYCTVITATRRPQHDTLAWLTRQLLIEPGVDPTYMNDHAALSERYHFDEEQQIAVCNLLDLPLPKRLLALFDALDMATCQQRMMQFINHLLCVRLLQQPLMIVLDDIHLADAVLIELIANLIELTQSHPLFLLLTTQTPNPLLLTASCATQDITTVDLLPLADKDARQLTTYFPALTEQYRLRCVQQALGNPLYLTQLLLNPSHNTLPMPSTLDESILLRYARLSANDKHAIELASALDEAFTDEILQVLLVNKNYSLLPLLDQQFIETTDTGYRFSHPQIRASIYHNISKPKRDEYHLTLARYFQLRDKQQYAQHLDAADDLAAVNAYLHAAQLEKAGYHYAACLHFLDRAAALCIDTQQRYEIALQRGELLLESNTPLLAIQAFELAFKLSTEPQAIARASIGMARGLYERNQYKAALNLLERAHSVFANSEHVELLAHIHHYRGAIYLHRQERNLCLVEHKLAVHFAELTRSIPSLVRCLNGLSQAYYHFAQFHLAEQPLARALNLAHEHHLGRFKTPALILQGLVDITQCRLVDAKTHFDLALTLANWAGNTTQASIASLGIAQIYLLQAQWQHAATFASLALTLAEKNNSNEHAAYALAYQALADSHLQPPASEDERVEKAYMLIAEHTDKYKTASILAILARTCHDAQRRTWALHEGEQMLEGIAASVDKLCFYTHAIESALAEKKWGRAENLADTLIMTMHTEPVPFYIMFAERARVLAKIGQGDRQETTHAELIFLYHQASQLNLLALLPAYKQALYNLTIMDTELTS